MGHNPYTKPHIAVIAFVLTAVLAVLLGGCTREQLPGGANAADETAKPIGIMIPLHQNQAPPAEMMTAVERAAQAKLEVDWIPNDNYKDKLINALQTNSLKQVTYVNQTDYGIVKNALRSDMFWEIGPYLEFYPNLKKLNKEILKETAVQEKLYGLYTERPLSRQGVILRKDWLDRLKLKEPTTVDELYEVLRQFTYNDPNGNGAQDTIGLADRGDLTYGAFKTLSSYFGTPNNWGVRDGKLVPDFMTAEYVDTMNYMKKLVSEGSMNKDFAVTSKQIQRYMLISGKAGGFIGSMEDAPRLLRELQKFEPNAQLTLINRIRGPKGEGVWANPGFGGLFLFSKKAIANEQELRRILAFFDRSMDQNVSKLLNFGIEGKHYKTVDGQIVVTAEMDQLYDSEVLPLTSFVIAGMSNPNLMKSKQEREDPLAVKADQLTKDNESILIRDQTLSLTSTTNEVIGGELAEVITNATYNYILGKIDLAQFRNEIATWEKRGGASIIREYNEAYQAGRN
ncbi:extracellular solute-binding protein [Paenibacillus sp. NPDC056579]